MVDADNRRRVASELPSQPVRQFSPAPVLSWSGRWQYLLGRRIRRGAVDAQVLQPRVRRLGARVVDAEVTAERGGSHGRRGFLLQARQRAVTGECLPVRWIGLIVIDRLHVDSVVLRMGSHEFHPDDYALVLDLDHKPVLVAAHVEHRTIIAAAAGAGLLLLNVLRYAPGRLERSRGAVVERSFRPTFDQCALGSWRRCPQRAVVLGSTARLSARTRRQRSCAETGQPGRTPDCAQ